jgi:hypothetical protein
LVMTVISAEAGISQLQNQVESRPCKRRAMVRQAHHEDRPVKKRPASS